MPNRQTFKINVREIPKEHPQLAAHEWVIPLVCRLSTDKIFVNSSRIVSVDVKRQRANRKCKQFEFCWKDLQLECERIIRSYQELEITEHATLALACFLVAEFINVEVSEVTRWGDSADFWLGNGLLLEVSGQSQGDLRALHKQKVAQLKRNRFGKAGYVCVANYRDAQALLTYHGTGG